jgi:hypothetical protein
MHFKRFFQARGLFLLLCSLSCNLSCSFPRVFCGKVKAPDQTLLIGASIIFMGGSKTASCKTDGTGKCEGTVSSGSDLEGWLLVFKKGYHRKVVPYTTSNSACAEIVLDPSL